jgi:D-alanine-D-alanine ligase
MPKNIAIVAGGDSSEYIVSVASAANIEKSLDRKLFKPWLITIRENRWMLGTLENQGPEVDKNDFSVTVDGNKISFDCAFIAIHGTPGEDGKLQGYFDLIGLPYTTSGVLTSAVTFNKYVCKGFLNNFGIYSPKAMLVKAGYRYDTRRIANEIGLPCFVKPNNGGSSFGVSMVAKESGLNKAIVAALKEDSEVIIEEYISGKEITSGVFKSNDRQWLFPLTEIVSKNEFFDFEAKYNRKAEEITPADISAELSDICRETSSLIYDLLDCRGIVRADYILKNDKFYFLEINTVPGMTDTSIIPQQAEAMGIDMTGLFTLLIEDAISNRKAAAPAGQKL